MIAHRREGTRNFSVVVRSWLPLRNGPSRTRKYLRPPSLFHKSNDDEASSLNRAAALHLSRRDPEEEVALGALRPFRVRGLLRRCRRLISGKLSLPQG